ncbi:DUF4087 domain-containing protein [Rhizobium sp. S95]|uniref:DUF4087 domain-containing protein n=1 Tax=Ciceribacter sichuanensis TaxID=2949647 RepID=A0AAJ1F732_9HYPH|nr:MULTISPECIES: DUF4087 domain-containing protein [unclassified Ciceribacter]MCM2399161.1 DUF4087 domain-containing protein [Ciceribacter sp. S95]MCO5956633.1 DUF4087 domain-containing protein [Ciceribacter sp. S101]
MSLRIVTLLIASASLLAATPLAAAPENRCGWIQNPTPGNYWLDDRDGTWIITTQGMDDEPLGMENFPDISTGDYVAVNGNYGYTCGCVKAETEKNTDPALSVKGKITAIYGVKLLPLKTCLADRNLPKPE